MRVGFAVLITILAGSQELHDVPQRAGTSLARVVISAPRCG
jgi:hypothetical protein